MRTIVTLLAISQARGFIAYDCAGPHLNITSFNSLGVGQCEIPTASKTELVTRIQLVQKTETYPINFKSCLISTDYTITRCSTFDDALAVHGGHCLEIIELGSARCTEIHQRLSYTFPLGGSITNSKVNQTMSVSHTIFGKCRGTTFKSDKGEWENAVVRAKFKITLYEGVAIANTIILPTGTRLKLSDTYGIDSYKGEIIWSDNY